MTKRAVLAAVILALATLALCACATTRTTSFDRYLAAKQWPEAAAAFAADSLLLHDADALYRAALLHGAPGRVTYDPERAAGLLQHLLATFPASRHRVDATERLALLTEVVQLQLELQRLKEIDLKPRGLRSPR